MSANAPSVVTVTVDRSLPIGVSELRTGVTHAQHDADSWNDPAAVASARQLLRASTELHNQHLMGWGADNPEPAPGEDNWGSLDERVQLMRDTGGEMVLTLCGAPDWMKGGVPGSTDWSRLEEAPLPAHDADFAALAARAALRYPDVRYFQVWNELKGFYSEERNDWDIVRYTDFYNTVYDAIKGVRPDAQVGGPYVVIDSWSDPAAASHPSMVGGAYGTIDQRALDAIAYWLQHKHGADFIALDASTGNKDEHWPSDEFSAAQKLVDVVRWLRRLDEADHPGTSRLPVWWSEWHPAARPGVEDPRRLNAIMANALALTVRSGAAAALLWQPQGDASGRSHPLGLYTDTARPGGGRPSAFFATQRGFHVYFAPGTALYNVRTSAPSVTALGSARATLLVNVTNQQMTVAIDRRFIALGPYGVAFVPVAGGAVPIETGPPPEAAGPAF